MTYNPRAAGFNYGIGWGKDPKPPVYYQAMLLAQRLGAEAMRASRQAWSVEMRARDLRLAETEEEKKRAVAALKDVVEKYDLAVASE